MRGSARRRGLPGWVAVAAGSLPLLLAGVAGADFTVGPFEIETRPAEILRDPFWPPPPIGYPPQNDAYAEAEASGVPKGSDFEATVGSGSGGLRSGPVSAVAVGNLSSAQAEAAIESGWTAVPAGPAFGFDISVAATAEGTTVWDPDGTTHVYGASARAMAGLTGRASVYVRTSDPDDLPLFGVYLRNSSQVPQQQVNADGALNWNNTVRQWEPYPDMQNYIPGRSPQEPSERDVAISGDILSVDFSAYGATSAASTHGTQTGTLRWSVPDAVTFGLEPLVEGHDYRVRTTLAPSREFHGSSTCSCAFAALAMFLDAWAGQFPALKQASGQDYAQALAATLPGVNPPYGLKSSEELRAVAHYVQGRLGADDTPLVPVFAVERGNLPAAGELAGGHGWPVVLGSRVYEYDRNGALVPYYNERTGQWQDYAGHDVLVTGQLVVRENLAEDDYWMWLAVWDTWPDPVDTALYDPEPGPWNGPLTEHNFTWQGMDWWPAPDPGDEDLRVLDWRGTGGWLVAEPRTILYLRPRSSYYQSARLNFAYPTLNEWAEDVGDVVRLGGQFLMQNGSLKIQTQADMDPSRLLLTCYAPDNIRLHLDGEITPNGRLRILVEDENGGRSQLLSEVQPDEFSHGFYAGRWSLADLGFDDQVVTLKLSLVGTGAECVLDRLSVWAVPDTPPRTLAWDAGHAEWGDPNWNPGSVSPSGGEQMVVPGGHVTVEHDYGEQPAETLLVDGGTVEVTPDGTLSVLFETTAAEGVLAVDGTLLADLLTVGTEGTLSGSGMIHADTVIIGGVFSPGGTSGLLSSSASGTGAFEGVLTGQAQVPEPGSLAMALAALAVLAARWASTRSVAEDRCRAGRPFRD